MLLYQWENMIRSTVEQVVDLQAAGVGGDFDDITVLGKYAGSKGITDDRNNNIK